MKACLALATVALLMLACGTQPGTPQAGKNDVPPKVVNQVQPSYPEAARKAGVEGVVTVEVVVGANGLVRDGIVIESSGNSLVDSVALEAAKASIFEPGTREGKPAQMKVNVPYRFELDDSPKDKRGQAPGGRFWTGWPGAQVCGGSQEPTFTQGEA